MIDAIQTAIAGLRVSALRFGVAANNIANAPASGGVEPYDGYSPQRLDQSTDARGGVRGIVQPIGRPVLPAYAPTDASANADGVFGMPNISLPAEFVDVAVARRSYEANVAVLETTNEMMRLLVDREV
ncbi:MAG: flagellar basal body rod C-terminal domain-containing protein [Alphaproteobacteria bacterium]